MPRHPGCPEFQRSLRQNRRGLLRLGALGTAGLTLGQLLQYEALAANAGELTKKDTSALPRSSCSNFRLMVPNKVPGTDASYLGASCQPFETQADPGNTTAAFSIPNLDLSGGVSVDRIESRQNLVESLDQLRRTVDKTGQMEALDAFNRQAWEIVMGPEARKAFDLES